MASEKKGNGWRRELLRDARGMAALMGVVGLILVSGFAPGALQSFRAGQPLYGWVFIINGVLIGVVMPAGGVLMEVNPVRGYAVFVAAVGGALGSAIGAGAHESFMAGDAAMGCILAFLAAVVTVGIPTGLTVFWMDLR